MALKQLKSDGTWFDRTNLLMTVFVDFASNTNAASQSREPENTSVGTVRSMRASLIYSQLRYLLYEYTCKKRYLKNKEKEHILKCVFGGCDACHVCLEDSPNGAPEPIRDMTAFARNLPFSNLMLFLAEQIRRE